MSLLDAADDFTKHLSHGSIIGPALTLSYSGGELALGCWQLVVLIELDGPRRRDIVLAFIQR